MTPTHESGRRLVGRPRPLSLLGFAVLLAIGVFGLTRDGGGVVGGAFTAVGGISFAAIAYARVWVDGPLLEVRTAFRGTRSVRLDQLTSLELSAFGMYQGPMLTVRDAAGTRLAIDATNLRLVPLYALLAQRLCADAPQTNPLLERRLARHRPRGLPFGPG